MILQPGWWWLVVVRADQRIWSQFPALPFSARHSPSTQHRQAADTADKEMRGRDGGQGHGVWHRDVHLGHPQVILCGHSGHSVQTIAHYNH